MIFTPFNFPHFQLWPENPTYQVYVPGYQHHVSMSHHPLPGQQPVLPGSGNPVYSSQMSIHRARSTSPNTTPNGLPLENPAGIVAAADGRRSADSKAHPSLAANST